jgi:photosystem II stability/assembly factor-like uncharacterized protein
VLAAALAAIALAVPSGPAIAFGDGQHGWAGGRGGLLGTADGGRTWRREAGGPVLALQALGGRTAWALAPRSVLRTTDGATWTRHAAPVLAALAPISARAAFAIDRGGVLRRTSDGVGWPVQAGAPPRLQALCFASPTRGWVARGGTVWRTRDGGGRWTPSRLLPTRQGFPFPQLGCRGSDVWAIFHQGAAAGTEGYRVLRSLDGGSTWRAVLATPAQSRLPSISNYSGPLSVLGGGRAVLVGRCDPCGRQPTVTIVRTADGGGTFSRNTPLGGFFPYDVSFVDARHGWLLTGSHARIGLVWRTSDGGRTWRTVLRSPALRQTP